jgi:hypothetical protein
MNRLIYPQYLKWSGRLGLCLLLNILPHLLASAQLDKQPITFTKDVAPIFQNKCESCHRNNSIAPMSLVGFEEVRPWAKSIKKVIRNRDMPPWHIDKTVGIQDFKNDRSLNEEQIEIIIQWVDSNAPKGDEKDMPASINWPADDGWIFAAQFGEPDLIVKSPAFTMPARAQDVWYRPVVPTGLTESRWVRAIEIRPTTLAGRRITHHALAALQQRERSNAARTNVLGDLSAGLFMEWAVGKQGELMTPNSGRLMLPRSKIMWDIHHHAIGTEITTAMELAIYFYPKGEIPKFRQVLGIFYALDGELQNLDIPPNSKTVHQGIEVMKRAGRIENFQPHMHRRGEAMSMEAILPDGSRRMLSHVDNFQFNWHTNYIYADHAAPILPAGTILVFTAWHDNTISNRDNPDSDQWVGWGDRTVDEMAHAWVNITYMNDEDYIIEVEKRKLKE